MITKGVLVAVVTGVVAASTALGGTHATESSSGTTRREVVQHGNIIAELDYRLVKGGSAAGKAAEDFTFSLSRDGERVVAEKFDGDVLLPKGLGNRPSVLLLDLDGDEEPEAIVNLMTCPGHCWYYTYVYRFVPDRGAYERTKRMWIADFRFTRLDSDAIPELRTMDDRFFGVFGCNSCFVAPIQLWHFEDGRFIDVSRQFDDVAASDAERWRQAYFRQRVRRYPDIRRELAAYVADQYLARQAANGWKLAFGGLRRGDLDWSFPGDLYPVGSTYMGALARLLSHTGYAETAPTAGLPPTRHCSSFRIGTAVFSSVVTDGVRCADARRLLDGATVTEHRRGRRSWTFARFSWRWQPVDETSALLRARAGFSAIYATFSVT